MYPGDIKSVLLSSEEIQAKVAELGQQLGDDYRDAVAENGQDLLLITVLKGAVFFVTDLARANQVYNLDISLNRTDIMSHLVSPGPL